LRLTTRIILATALAALASAWPAEAGAQTTRGRARTRPRTTGRGTTTPPARPAAQQPARPGQPAARTAQPPVNLSAQDVALIVEGLGVPPPQRAQLAASAEERKKFTKDLREMFALAEEARAAGLADRPETRIQLELSRAFVVARAYFRKREAEGAKGQDEVISPAEVESFLKEIGQGAKFAEFIEDYQRNRPAAQRDTPVTPDERASLEQQWARVMIAARKGVAAGLDRTRPVEVMVAYQHARLLAGAYFRETLRARSAATEQEIDAYIAAHPELDTSQARAQAEQILKRLQAGEDFAALARQFSADGSREQGGDLGWFGRKVMVKPFEDAAFGLQPGQLSGIVETQFGFHIIKVEERRAEGPNGAGEQVRARHILIRSGARPGAGTPREQARAAVEREKTTRLVEEIARRSRVVVAEDFPAEPSPPPPAPPAQRPPASSPPRGR
jgi:parvulin-like peptidyl-prolyl isomerase